MNTLFPPVTFLLSAAEPTQFPADTGNEIAFIGRSNSGKSSAINAITGNKKLAKTSKTPGRTQLINFFAIHFDSNKADAIQPNKQNKRFATMKIQTTKLLHTETPIQHRLVDLPGYGYAKVPLTIKQHWGKLIIDYLNTRHSLHRLVLIMDIRHPLQTFDQQMLAWVEEKQLPVHILLTKADKISHRLAMQTLQQVSSQLKTYALTYSIQLFSVSHPQEINTARVQLVNWVNHI